MERYKMLMAFKKLNLEFIQPWWLGGRACGLITDFSLSRQWMIAQMAELLLCTRRTRVLIPALAPYEITL